MCSTVIFFLKISESTISGPTRLFGNEMSNGDIPLINSAVNEIYKQMHTQTDTQICTNIIHLRYFPTVIKIKVLLI